MRVILIVFLIFFNVLSNIKLNKIFNYDYLLLGNKKLSEVIKYQDVWSIVFGLRRVAADLAFVQEVIYYGSPQYEPHEKHKHRHIHLHFHPHLKLLNYAKRVLRLDYHFHFANLFSASALAFVQKRPEEAIELLKEALVYNPKYWKYSLYLGAITIRKEKGEKEVIPFLKKIIQGKRAPDIVKNYFALLCEKYGYIEDAYKMWQDLLDSRDENYRRRAQEHIKGIKEGRLKILTFPD